MQQITVSELREQLARMGEGARVVLSDESTGNQTGEFDIFALAPTSEVRINFKSECEGDKKVIADLEEEANKLEGDISEQGAKMHKAVESLCGLLEEDGGAIPQGAQEKINAIINNLS